MTDQLLDLIVGVLMLLILLPLHESAHAYMANRLGDPTARSLGRLTLNPFRHIDPIGAILMLTVHFGWGKPVPVDTRYFKKPKRDMAMVALAGPLSNLAIALVLVAAERATSIVGMQLVRTNGGMQALVILLYMIRSLALTSIYLAVFNMIPVPPLDGSRLLEYLIPGGYYARIARFERIIHAVLLALLLFTNVLTRPMSILAGWLLDVMYLITAWIPFAVNLLFR